MSQPPPILERAYELARSGAYRSVSEVKAKLASEGYTAINSLLYGKSLNDDLRRLCRDARPAQAE
jgi:hypothetical protein